MFCIAYITKKEVQTVYAGREPQQNEENQLLIHVDKR